MNGIVKMAAVFAVFCGVSLGVSALEIVKAVYGAGDATADVTEIVKAKALNVLGSCFVITPDNAFFGSDPARGKAKTLVLTYKQDGAEKTATIPERSTFVLLDGAVPAKEFQILKAFYGAEDKWNDVTDKVATAVKEGNTLIVGRETFADPNRGKVKRLIVVYTVNEKLIPVIVAEREELKAELFNK